MSKNLSVPYSSQWDSDGSATRNDCGPASVKMILNYYGENLTIDDVFKKTGAGGGLISWTQLQNAISALGYKSNLERKQNLSRVRDLINQDTPPILLVHYGSLKSTQDKVFKGGHFFTVVGHYQDGFFVNDPNFKAPIRNEGDHHNYLTNELNVAWNDCILDGNQAFSLLWIERKVAPTPTPSPIGDKTPIPLGKIGDREYGSPELQALKSDILAKDSALKSNEQSIINKDKEIEELKKGPQFTKTKADLFYKLAIEFEKES